ncbi:unnamed protein product [Lampetra fluviatilis]
MLLLVTFTARASPATATIHGADRGPGPLGSVPRATCHVPRVTCPGPRAHDGRARPAQGTRPATGRRSPGPATTSTPLANNNNNNKRRQATAISALEALSTRRPPPPRAPGAVAKRPICWQRKEQRQQQQQQPGPCLGRLPLREITKPRVVRHGVPGPTTAATAALKPRPPRSRLVSHKPSITASLMSSPPLPPASPAPSPLPNIGSQGAALGAAVTNNERDSRGLALRCLASHSRAAPFPAERAAGVESPRGESAAAAGASRGACLGEGTAEADAAEQPLRSTFFK